MDCHHRAPDFGGRPGLAGCRCKSPARSLPTRLRQALQNICTVLAEAHAGPEHIVRLNVVSPPRMNILRTSTTLALPYRDVMGKNFPVMSVVQVRRAHGSARPLKNRTTAVIPDKTEAADSAAGSKIPQRLRCLISSEDIVTPRAARNVATAPSASNTNAAAALGPPPLRPRRRLLFSSRRGWALTLTPTYLGSRDGTRGARVRTGLSLRKC